ncbi:hypothetical protein RSAG8_11175, partial [Rhizoctonia solani AG-8 WAC10335]
MGLLCFAAARSPKQAAVSKTTFNVMSMSVAGLPAVLDPLGPSDHDKERNTMYIGMKMSQYDYGIINVQEDFSHNKALYLNDNHPFRTKSSGDAPSGSGLNTLSRFDWVDFSSIPWDVCSAASEESFDCIVNKGFTFMRVRIDEGVYIDMINLDTNAGTESDDQVARRSNIRRVANFIDANSAGNAVIVFGNTHARYTQYAPSLPFPSIHLSSEHYSSKDNIRLFTTQNALIDAWIQAIGGNAPVSDVDAIACPKGVPPNISCEVEDKVFYRGSPLINLKSSGFFYDTARFLSPEGKTLTDRNPIRVEFGYTLKSGLRQSDLYGGPHGTWFNDLPSIPSSPKLSSITLRGGDRLDGLTLSLTSGQVFTHGGSGGDSHSLAFASGEYVTSVKLCWGKKNGHTRNYYAQATTNKNRTVQAGKATSDCATSIATSGYGVVGAYGQDGHEIDQLGFIYGQQ